MVCRWSRTGTRPPPRRRQSGGQREGQHVATLRSVDGQRRSRSTTRRRGRHQEGGSSRRGGKPTSAQASRVRAVGRSCLSLGRPAPPAASATVGSPNDRSFHDTDLEGVHKTLTMDGRRPSYRPQRVPRWKLPRPHRREELSRPPSSPRPRTEIRHCVTERTATSCSPRSSTSTQILVRSAARVDAAASAGLTQVVARAGVGLISTRSNVRGRHAGLAPPAVRRADLQRQLAPPDASPSRCCSPRAATSRRQPGRSRHGQWRIEVHRRRAY